MNFIDLEKLNIKREYNFVTKELVVELTTADTIFDLKEKFRTALNYFFDKTAIETYFDVKLITSDEAKNIDDADAFFTTAVNVFTSVFLDEMCIKPNQGRARERRLGVPESLQTISASMSLIKKNINMQTYCDRFNLSIDWDNGGLEYHYTLVPQRGDEDYDN